MCPTGVRVEVLLHVKDQVYLAAIEICHCTERISRSQGNKACDRCVTCAGKDNHLRCSAISPNRGYSGLSPKWGYSRNQGNLPKKCRKTSWVLYGTSRLPPKMPAASSQIFRTWCFMNVILVFAEPEHDHRLEAWHVLQHPHDPWMFLVGHPCHQIAGSRPRPRPHILGKGT